MWAPLQKISARTERTVAATEGTDPVEGNILPCFLMPLCKGYSVFVINFLSYKFTLISFSYHSAINIHNRVSKSQLQWDFCSGQLEQMASFALRDFFLICLMCIYSNKG